MAYETELEEELEQELEGELEAEEEGEYELEAEEEFEDEGEFEEEGEFEFEEEGEVSPIRKIYPDSMMEHLGALAAESESEEEAAEHFLPLIGMAASKLLPLAAKAIGPLAKKALPRVIKAVTKVAPKLTRGVGKIARTLHRQPAGRRLLRAVPTIARRTVHSIARQAAHGRPITARTAVRTLAHQARRVIRSPHHRRHAIRRNYRLDRRFHRQIGRGVVPRHIYTRRIVGPGVVTHGAAVPGRGAVRIRRAIGGVCPPCPACGTRTVHAAAAVPAPNYCRCCGQLIR